MTHEEGNEIEVDQDTVVGWTLSGDEIKASQLQVWAYRRLDAFPDLLAALMQAVGESGHKLNGPADWRAAEDGEPPWVCNARAAMAKAA